MKTGMRDIILLGSGQHLGDTCLIMKMREVYPALLLETNVHRDCKNDHGDRTNYRLKDQPFYARNKTGKMKSW